MDVNVAIYTDSNYSVPATVMVRSLLENARAGIRIRLFVLAVEIPEQVKRAMASSWPAQRLEVHWVDVDIRAYENIFAHIGYLSKAAYVRLLLDRCLPPQLERVITLDCDGVMLGDIGELWQREHGAHCIMAVRDPCVSRLRDDLSDFVQALPDDKSSAYFNSGLMVVDLKAWREREISSRCLALAGRNAGRSLYADQSFLNVVLRDAWEPLPLRWNCNLRHLAIHAYPSMRDHVYPYQQVLDALRAPGFCHFLSSHKPWHATAFHPHRDTYRTYLARTAWPAQPSPASATQRLKTLARKNLFPLLCYRQAREAARGQGLVLRRWADFRHLSGRFLTALT
jgi:lipopolysaccharide biosynthesis glycosyltransferase